MTAGKLIIDTGPLVALLHPKDRDHDRCAAFLQSYRGILVTTEAVLTEGLHLLSRVVRGPETCLEFFLRGGATLVPPTLDSLARCRQLMSRYANVPMDYADATLVTLAEETGFQDIFTLDRRGFAVYRTDRGRPLRIHPGSRR